MKERPGAIVSGLSENKSSRVPRAALILAPAVLALLAVACSDDSSELVNINEFECETTGFKILDDGEGHIANQLSLKLSSDILTDDLEKLFREEQLCVASGVSIIPNSFTIRVPQSEKDEAIEARDEAIERLEEELGDGVEEVVKLERTKFE